MDGPKVSTRVKVRGDSIDPGALLDEVSRPSAGAIVLFLGTARDHSEGKPGITELEYEAYPEMVEVKLAEVVAEAVALWQVEAVVVEHRIGRVALGTPSVAVAVAAAHREEAFAAGRFLIDELKTRVPLWKKEHWVGGGEWVKGA